jgi:hypothetical protein
MMEQGQKIYSAIFKRIWRSMKSEFKKLYDVNAVHLDDEEEFGEGLVITREDYSMGSMNVCPVADPTITSDVARFARAQLIRTAAQEVGGYDTDAVERNFLRAMGIDEVDTLFPGMANMPQGESEKVTLQKLKNEAILAKLEQEKMFFVITMQETSRLNSAKIAQLEAQAAKLQIDAQTEPQKNAVAAFRAAIEAMREQNNSVNAQLDREMESLNNVRKSRASAVIPSLEGESGDAGGLSMA